MGERGAKGWARARSIYALISRAWTSTRLRMRAATKRSLDGGSRAAAVWPGWERGGAVRCARGGDGACLLILSSITPRRSSHYKYGASGAAGARNQQRWRTVGGWGAHACADGARRRRAA